MPELNILTACLVGVASAAIWVVIGIRRSLRGLMLRTKLNKRIKVVAWSVAGFVFPLALVVGFVISAALADIAVQPGPWNHLVLDLTFFFGVGLVGALVTWAAAIFSARGLAD